MFPPPLQTGDPLEEVAVTLGVLCLTFAFLLGIPAIGYVRSREDAPATERDSDEERR